MGGAILITGAPGWLGSRLVLGALGELPEVIEGTGWQPPGQVRCLLHGRRPLGSLRTLGERLVRVPGDLRDRASIRPFFADAEGATLFHCAGLIHPERRVADFFVLNAEGTRDLVDLASAAGVRRFVHVSSSSTLGANDRGGAAFDERSPLRPYLGYGESKADGERAVLRARERGMEVVIVRPPWFYGPGQPPRQATFFRLVRRGMVPLVGGGANLRSMVYVDDLVQALLRCAVVPEAEGQCYWIADERPYPLREVVDVVGDVLRRDFGVKVRRPVAVLPPVVGRVARALDRELQGLGRYHTELHVLGELGMDIAGSIHKARRELGYRPSVGLREGMRRSIADLLAGGGSL